MSNIHMSASEYRQALADLEAEEAQKKTRKYRNRIVNDPQYGRFDSQHEYNRWRQLLLLERQHVISDLQRQVPYQLVPTQRDAKGNVLEKPITYKADFVYKDENGNVVVEDAKGDRTGEYIIKRKLMLYTLGIRIREV